MKTTTITPEQFAQYEAIISEYDRFRVLSQEEKEDLIIRIATSTYIDLLSDWAFKHVFGHDERNLMLLLNDILPEEIIHIVAGGGIALRTLCTMMFRSFAA